MVGKLAVQDDAASVWFNKPGDQVECRRLSATRRAKQREKLASCHFDVEVIEDDLFIEQFCETVEAQARPSARYLRRLYAGLRIARLMP
jgi:hypothetical protein